MDDSYYCQLRESISKASEKIAGIYGREAAKYLLLAPDLLVLLMKLLADERVPLRHKSYLVLAIAYFVSPFDFLPEFLMGALGLVDDLVITVVVLHKLMNEIEPSIIEEKWSGEGEILDITKRILEVADDLVGCKMYQRLKDHVKSK